MIDAMWNEVRADRVRRQLLERCRAPLSATELLTEALALVHQAVPVDASCAATFDPATTLITSTVAHALDRDAAALERSLHLEYTTPGPLAFRAMKAARHAVAVVGVDDLHAGTAAEQRRREHLAPMGFSQELRWVLSRDEAAWGGVGMLRAGGRGFSDEERAFLARVGPALADGLRACMVRTRANGAAIPDGPAVLVFERGELANATAAGRAILDALSALDHGRGADGLPLVVRTIARVAAGGATVSQRLQVEGLGHLTMQGAPLGHIGAIVTIERTRPPEVVTLIGAALGLTAREREVVEGVLRGLSTKELAQALCLSPYTVQDHLKAIFEKADVRSRRELVADVFFGYAAPRLLPNATDDAPDPGGPPCKPSTTTSTTTSTTKR